ncbi:substrate-binding domain-containing protein [Propionicimonas sp.]|uniref:PstS family phosphate ABC transporter substrate-binding protein n=1 Tax=Propionicimonas sp. TaxID=1955623 RepID=UPI0017AC3652|nr:substrate-binding domain-containing protein [Propionicimonas sp.]MBU3976105.1 substrate-binding domain-containing protein [Actinomycetota bacterium]MBA3020918.1 phosphate ABC transporter substrate-binding protein [Propionicimonas sp.]MBU3985295.1 substrate-binding domain-containing protein [Actinomycetota bacterium]MBU4008285.1 substrate-binding domain-containing protein [Actinomycetota bacterium]MBU4064501.1 substrate-binding domain-containing protein [Actinomycetota bacterium]
MLKRIVLAIAVAALLAGCVATPPASTPAGSNTPAGETSTASFRLADLPVIDGSTANIPLISLMIQRLTGATATEADNAVHTTGTPTAYRNLVDGSADLLVIYEPDQDTVKAIEESGVKLESYPIGRDALVFFTNSTNPVKSLTTKQYKDIDTGKITNWKSVGGKDVKIVAYQRPEASGSQALLRKYVMGKTKMAKAPSDMITAEMGTIIDKVSSYENTGNAMGYSVYYYLANMYAVPGIKMLSVGGVEPTTETIAAGTYPYGNDFYVVVRADAPADSPARKVLAWIRSEAGAKTVTDAGYAPTK